MLDCTMKLVLLSGKYGYLPDLLVRLHDLPETTIIWKQSLDCGLPHRCCVQGLHDPISSATCDGHDSPALRIGLFCRATVHEAD